MSIAYYGAEFKRSGFTAALNWYRNLDKNWQLMTSYKHAKITVPAVFISSDRDPMRAQTQLNYWELEKNVPRLTMKVEIPNCGHWTKQERPTEATEATAAILEFLKSLRA